MWRPLRKLGAGGNSAGLKQKKQTQNPAAVALGAQLGGFDKASLISWGKCKVIGSCLTLSLAGAVTSEVQNLGLAIYCGKGKEEECLTSIRLGQVQYINDNEKVFYLVSYKCNSCPCPHNILLAM